MLLLLDNFEHLLSTPTSDPAPELLLDSMGLDGEAAVPQSPPQTGINWRVELLSDILTAAPGVKFLVTSREVLNLQEECLYHVDGLPYPELPPASSPQEEGSIPKDSGEDWGWLEEYGAVQLFVERARRVRRDFSLFDEAADVVRICRLVEGVPLAIELAASWAKTMPCSAIAAEIQRNLDFLATSLRNVPDRQRSMRAIFDQSWQLLTQKERDVFKRLSVLRGSFSREAAERIAGASLAILSALVDKSLMRTESRARYHIHELLRQYAALQLAQSPEDIARVYDLHCTYYADFLRSRQEEMFSSRQREMTAEIKAELDNIRAAWNWAVGMLKVCPLLFIC